MFALYQSREDSMSHTRRKPSCRRPRPIVTTKRSLLFVLLSFLLLTSSVDAERRRRTSRQSSSTTTPRQFANPDDYYGILGVKKTAKPKEIKSAYRKLALQYHPDKVTGSEADKEAAKKTFVLVSEAYAVLSEDEKRSVYDKYGKRGLELLERGVDPEQAGFGTAETNHGFSGSNGGHFGGFPGGGGGFGTSGGSSNGHQYTYHYTSNGHPGGGAGAGFDPFSMFEEMFGGSAAAGGAGTAGAFPFGGSSSFGAQPKAAVELFPKTGKVTKLGSTKFPDRSSKYLWLVIFYSNASRSCADAAPQMELLHDKIKGVFRVGAFDCASSEKEARFCAQHRIRVDDLPVFGFVRYGEIVFYEESNRVPSAKSLYEFAMTNLPKSLIHNVNTIPQLQDRLLRSLRPTRTATSSPRAAVLLLTDKYETSPLLSSLAYQYRDVFAFGESRAKNLALSKTFHVKKYPHLLALVPKSISLKGVAVEPFLLLDEFAVVLYTNNHDLTHDGIAKWLDTIEAAIKSSSSSTKSRSWFSSSRK